MAITHILEAATHRPLSSEEVTLIKDALAHPEQLVLTVNPSLYPLPAIHRVLYWLAEDVPLCLKTRDDGEIALLAPEPLETERLSELRKKLLIALNDFTLRLDVEEKTASVRNRLVQTALCETVGKTAHDAC